MKIYRSLACVILAGIAGAFPQLQAQSDGVQTAKDKKAYNEKVLVTAPYQPNLGNVNKPVFRPSFSDTTVQSALVDYQINSRPYSVSYPVENIKAAKMLGEPIAKLWNNTIRLGVGWNSYKTVSPLAELNFGIGRNRKYEFATFLRHHSTFGTIKDYDRFKSNNSHTEAHVKGGIITDKFLVNMDLMYNQNLVNCYGLNNDEYNNSQLWKVAVDEDFVDQSKRWYQNAHGVVTFKDNARKEDDIRFDAYLDYNLNTTNWRRYMAENTVIAGGNVSRQIMDTRKGLDALALGARFRFEDNTFRDGISDGGWLYEEGTEGMEQVYVRGNELHNAYHVEFGPDVRYTYEFLELNAALMFHVFGNNASKAPRVEKQTKFQFNPVIDLRLHIIDKILTLYFGTDGGVRRNTVDYISSINPYLHPLMFTDLGFTRDKFNAYVGLTGNFTRHIDFRIEASAHFMEDMLSFDYYRYDFGLHTNYYGYNDFVPLYSGDIFNLKARGDLNFRWDERILAHVDATYNYYEKTLYYAPAFKANIAFKYNMAGNRLSLYTNLMISTGMKALDRKGNEIWLNRKGVYDWSLGAEYRFIKRMTAFLNLNNIIGQRYYLWNDYQAYRFSFMAGITVDF